MTWLIPSWLKRAVAGLVAGAALLWGSYVAGKRDGRQKADTASAKANVKAAKQSKDTRHEMETSDDQRLVDILTGKLHNGKR